MVFDIEADGLIPTKIHCLSVNVKGKIQSTTDYDKMRKFFLNAKILIGHNIVRWDIPQIERLLEIKITGKLVDTLALSWYLNNDLPVHGLEYWGTAYKIKKPKIDDWENLGVKEYIHRCERDVQINSKLWGVQWMKLNKLYDNEEDAWRIIDYLTNKLKAAALQEKNRWKLDVFKCKGYLKQMEVEKESKVATLSENMPSVKKIVKKSRPEKMYKKNGDLTSMGMKWYALIDSKGLKRNYQGEIEVVSSEKDPNPNSHIQIKNWLFGLGWKPVTFDTVEKREIPQINTKKGICESIKVLYKGNPELELIEGLGILSNRISILKNFVKNVDDEGYLKAQIGGFTNTLRFKHRVIVNLPKIDRPFGKEIRGVLIADNDTELCGSDMESLEDKTKQHYMYKYDREFVREMMQNDFDPHLDLAVFAKALTREQALRHKSGEEDFSGIRSVYKQVNYMCVYGASYSAISKSSGLSLVESKELFEAYWDRNWAVRKIEKDAIVKTALGKKWLYNPVSGFWYFLKNTKDKFSTLNQGTGTYCFDMWVENILKVREQLTGQMHDEIILQIKKGCREPCEKLLIRAIDEVNEELNLNINLGIDIKFGNTYAEIH